MAAQFPELRSLAPRLEAVRPGLEHLHAAHTDEDEGLRLAHYWAVLRRYKWSIFGIAIIAALLGGLAALSAVPIYRADVRLLVAFNQPNITTLQQLEAMPAHWLYYETQIDIIKSRAIAERVVDSLHLDTRQPADNAPESAQGLRLAWLDELRAALPDWQAWIPEEWRPPAPRPALADDVKDALIAEIAANLDVKGGQESEVLRLSYESPSATRAAAIANAVAEAYINFGLESRLSTVQQTTSWLGERIQELRKKVERSESALREFQSVEGMVDTENREKIISAKLGSLTTELIRAQTARGEADARYNQVKGLLGQKTGYQAVVALLNNPMLIESRRSKAALERRVSELSERYGDRHPKMIAARADRQEAIRRLRQEVDKAVQGVRKDAEVARAQEHKLSRFIQMQQTEMRGLSGKAFTLAKLEREVEGNRRLYETYLERFKEADIANKYDATNVRIIDPAKVPGAPVKPDKARMVAVYIVMGLFLGVFIALLREHLDNTFKTREDVENELGLPVLGVLERLKLRRRDGVPVERYVLREPRTAFSEVVNDVRTAVLFSDVDNPPAVVLVTSAVPGEGKTTLAANLALSFRRRGKCLLIEADLRQGALADVFGLSGASGLTDVVTGECTLKDAIHRDAEARNLYVLTAGTWPPNPLEVLSSRRFAKALAEIRKAFDYVVIDGPPLLPISDSIVLAHQVDAVVLAVKAESTTLELASEAKKRLESARVKPVGVVLQQVDLHRLRSYSGRYADLYDKYYAYEYVRPSATKTG